MIPSHPPSVGQNILNTLLSCLKDIATIRKVRQSEL